MCDRFVFGPFDQYDNSKPVFVQKLTILGGVFVINFALHFKSFSCILSVRAGQIIVLTRRKYTPGVLPLIFLHKS